MRLLAAAAFATLAITAAFAADPVIDKIEAKLFISTTGDLSPNIIDNPDVTLWNTIIADGEFGPATDTLVIVTLKSDPGISVETPLDIVISGLDGKTLTSRTIKGLHAGENGVFTTAVLIPDSTCSAFNIKATIGSSEKSALAGFACGE